jgi:hypothetical protein
MVAMHGREDPLLDAGRFHRLLRQANDAEVADVRKVGDDEYEVSPHRTAAAAQLPVTRETPALPPAETPPPAEPADAGTRDNGQRFGVRFRRGSRAPLRPGDIPLIGVVQIETPEPAAVAVAEPEEEAPEPKKPARPRRPRKRAAAAAAAHAAQPEGGEEAAEKPAARPRRPRARAKKNVE